MPADYWDSQCSYLLSLFCRKHHHLRRANGKNQEMFSGCLGHWYPFNDWMLSLWSPDVLGLGFSRKHEFQGRPGQKNIGYLSHHQYPGSALLALGLSNLKL